jgi:hypothetical protein
MFTYIIQGISHGPVKIGRAEDVADRVKTLQTGHHDELRVLLVLDGDRESELHKRFRRDRIRGEWFRWSVDIETFVAERFGGRCSVWHMVNCYCNEEQREQFNQWRHEAYQHADTVRDWIRHRSFNGDLPIPDAMDQLIGLLSKVPILLE